jgi:hypothetical protein
MGRAVCARIDVMDLVRQRTIDTCPGRCITAGLARRHGEMIQRDYIMRMIEQFGQFVTALVHLRETGKLEEARAVIDQAMIGLVGTDLRSASEQPVERLIATVRFATRMYATTSASAQQLNLLGRLLREAAQVLDLQNDDETATKVRFQAMEVHSTVLLVDDPASSESAAALDALVTDLQDYEFPSPLKRRLWTIHAARGEYARAEDWLFDILDEQPASADLLAEAIGFYEQLAAMDEDVLQAGGISRDEARISLAELRQRLPDTGSQRSEI